MDEHKTVVRRLALLIAAASVVFALYTLRLIFLQVVHGDEFAARATSTTEYRFNVTAARGDIVDSAGRRIATSTTCYNVELSRLLIGDNDLNETIRSAVEILQANGESWNDTLLIGYADGAGLYAFTGDPDSTSDQNSIARVKETLGLQQYATANDVMDRLIEKYELEEYDSTWQRILGGIHYQMEQEAFSNVNNFTLAENVSDQTVATVKEHSLTLPGVEIAETSVRSYTDGTILPHVLGRVGKITAEMWRVTDENGQVTYPLRDRGYAMNDVIGISGLESAYEEQLRGQDGVETITRDSDGVIIDTSITTEPQPGKTVMLTVNSEFQKAVDEALARNVQQIADTYNVDASAGAVVVIDVKNGGILACSNYPSYDQNLYSTQYSAYSADPGLPLYNRALQGLYTPGSTFKPSVAVAALLSGVIDRNSTVYCNGVYNYFSDYHPRCTRHGHSGNIDVVTAIKWSCNIFFYDVGRRTTSDVYDDYAHRLGLGTPTGVEVSESTGRLTTKEDSNYTASLEVQAAIGQGNTVVTPVSWPPMRPPSPTRACATAPTLSRRCWTPTPAKCWRRPPPKWWRSSRTTWAPSTSWRRGWWAPPRRWRAWPITPTPSPARPAPPSAANTTWWAAAAVLHQLHHHRLRPGGGPPDRGGHRGRIRRRRFPCRRAGGGYLQRLFLRALERHDPRAGGPAAGVRAPAEGKILCIGRTKTADSKKIESLPKRRLPF